MNYPQQVAITVAQIVPPQPGKKQWKVIDTTGKQWGIWADRIGDYAPGSSYLLTKIKSNQFQGKTYFTIEESNLMPAAPAGMPAPQVAIPNAAQSYFPPAQTAGVNKDEMIFVCGALNNTLANPSTPAASMGTAEYAHIVRNLREAWAQTFGGQGDEQ